MISGVIRTSLETLLWNPQTLWSAPFAFSPLLMMSLATFHSSLPLAQPSSISALRRALLTNHCCPTVSCLPPILSICPAPKLHQLSTLSHSTQRHYATPKPPPPLTARVTPLSMLCGSPEEPQVRQSVYSLPQNTAPCQHRTHHRPNSVASAAHWGSPEGEGLSLCFLNITGFYGPWAWDDEVKLKNIYNKVKLEIAYTKGKKWKAWM